MKKPFAILISGRGTNLQALLEANHQGNLTADPRVVISDQRDAGGLKIAQSLSIKSSVLPWTKNVEKNALKILADHRVEFVVLAGFMRILRDELLHGFPGKIINIHPSLLPAFPGKNAQAQAVLSGVSHSGCTTHFVTSEVDGGPIILQKSLALSPGETAGSLAEKILPWEHKILIQTVNLFAVDALEIVDNRQVVIHWDRWESRA